MSWHVAGLSGTLPKAMSRQKSIDKTACTVSVQGEELDDTFHHQVRWKAEENHLVGYSEAHEPGKVTLLFQGLGRHIDKMLDWLRHGDHKFHISRMHRRPAKLEDRSEFEIRR